MCVCLKMLLKRCKDIEKLFLFVAWSGDEERKKGRYTESIYIYIVLPSYTLIYVGLHRTHVTLFSVRFYAFRFRATAHVYMPVAFRDEFFEFVRK